MSGQGTPSWVAQRRGFLTASRVKDALAKTKTGWAESRSKLMMEIVAERITGIAVSHYVTPAMEHGIEQEPMAVAAYEALSGEIARECGFFEHPAIPFFGATPDRLLGDDGVLECKCPTTTTFLKWVMAGEVPKEHRPQLLGQLACTRRQYADFIAYDPRMPESKRAFIRRFVPQDGEVAEIEQLAAEFLAEADRMFEIIVNTPAAA